MRKNPGSRSRRATIRLIFLTMALVQLLGCPTATTNGAPLPESLRKVVFCVERQPKDTRNLGVQIAESLREAGLAATSADTGMCRDEPRFRITYIDNWSWDFRVFLAKMTVEVIDISTDEIVAYGESYQGSDAAMGMSFRDVIDGAVVALLESE